MDAVSVAGGDDRHYFFSFNQKMFPHTWIDFCRFTGKRSTQQASPLYSSTMVVEAEAQDHIGVSDHDKIGRSNPLGNCNKGSSEGGRDKDSSEGCREDCLNGGDDERDINREQCTSDQVWLETGIAGNKNTSDVPKSFVERDVDGKEICSYRKDVVCLGDGSSPNEDQDLHHYTDHYCIDKEDVSQHYSGDHASIKDDAQNEMSCLVQTETVVYSFSECYSPDGSFHSCQTSTLNSPASVFPSTNSNVEGPQSLATNNVFGSSHTAPSEASNKTNAADNLVKPEKLRDTVRLSLHPAEKLSEWKRKKIIENLVKIKNDGTVELDVDRSAQIVPNLFGLDTQAESDIDQSCEIHSGDVPSRMNIAILIVGTRGDVQPFVAIGKRLKEKGHRVRLATHSNFREFVTRNGLEFFPLGGDPKVLAGYMVKNKGFVPSGPSEISTQKKQLRAIMHSLLPACTKPDGPGAAPFLADTIIANPPAYGHVHVAEYLNVPLHIFFTMPWTPTNEFPHPMARVNKLAGYKMSYHVVESLMWWGMRSLVNEFRIKELNLNPIYFNTSQGSITHLPTGYMWSPHLVPKPKDWGSKVDVVGFCFLDLATGYKPPETLLKWLEAGEKPIYVGFGSLPVEHPGKMTEIIVQALEETNQRGIICKGWGGLGDVKETPDSIFLLESCPHDWLFPKCAAVVHHGGAGTTAAGLRAGCPTTIVPFFGDQPFWGERVYAKGVGPPPIPVQQFSLEKLVHAIMFMLDEKVKCRAVELAKQMEQEDGVEEAVNVFYKHWVKKPPLPSVTSEPLSFFDMMVVILRKMWCLPWCFD